MTTASSAVIRSGLQRLSWTVSDLWIATVSVGGSFSRQDVEDLTTGGRAATPIEHDILVAALNDRFVDLGTNHPLATWSDLRPSTA